MSENCILSEITPVLNKYVKY